MEKSASIDCAAHHIMCLLTLRGESTEGIVTIESAGHVDSSSNRSSGSIDANTELYYLWLLSLSCMKDLSTGDDEFAAESGVGSFYIRRN